MLRLCHPTQWICAIGLLLAAGAQAQQKHVLLLLESSGGADPETMHTAITRSLRGLDENVDVMTERYDLERFERAEFESAFTLYLLRKYSDAHLDLAIVMGNAALELVTENRQALLPNAPIVFVTDATNLPATLPDNTTGVTADFTHPAGTLALARTLQPDAGDVIVVSGSGSADRAREAIARRQLQSIADSPAVRFLSGLSLSATLRELTGVPQDSIIILLGFGRDGNGERFVPAIDIIPTLAASAAAPVYGTNAAFLGHGIVGGFVSELQLIGAVAGTLAARVLGGESADAIPVEHVGNRNVVDERQVMRWNLDASRLPRDTVTAFREPSVWNRYRTEFVVAGVLVTVQSLVIVILLLRTRKLRLEEALRTNQERFRHVVESQTDLVCRYLPDGTLSFTNEACCRHFGRSKAQLIGTPLLEMLPASQRAEAAARIRSLIAEPRTLTHTQTGRNARGDTVWHQWVEHVIVGPDGRAMEIQAIGRDITELKLAEAEARQHREQVTHLTRVAILGEFSGALAHELTQPLTAILSNIEVAGCLLDQDEPDLNELRAIVGDVAAENRRAVAIISRLRALLKKGEIAFGPVDVSEIAHEALRVAHSQLLEAHVSVDARLAPDLPSVRGDRIQLEQVLLNLIANACDAMRTNDVDDRRLSITTWQEGPGIVAVAVADNGCGMPPDTSSRVFEPFVTTKAVGLGLGLSICRSIVRTHGGDLTAKNLAGRGAEFRFELIAQRPADSRLPPKRSVDAPARIASQSAAAPRKTQSDVLQRE